MSNDKLERERKKKPPHLWTSGAGLPAILAQINPDDFKIIRALTERARKYITGEFTKRGIDPGPWVETDTLALQMDFCIAFITRRLRLLAFLMADDLAFQTDFIAIQKSINRVDMRVPEDVKLQFAQEMN